MQKVLLKGSGISLADAVHSQAVYDIEIMTHYLRDAKSLTDLVYIRNFAMREADLVADALLSAGCSASLVGYRRKGAEWRYDAARRGSVRGDQIIDALDDLRLSISEIQDTIGVLSRHKKIGGLPRATALVALALDAVDDEHFQEFTDVAEIPEKISDVAGYALFLCERHFEESDRKPAPKKSPESVFCAGRRLTADPTRGKPRRRLTANPDAATNTQQSPAIARGGKGFCGKNKNLAHG